MDKLHLTEDLVRDDDGRVTVNQFTLTSEVEGHDFQFPASFQELPDGIDVPAHVDAAQALAYFNLCYRAFRGELAHNITAASRGADPRAAIDRLALEQATTAIEGFLATQKSTVEAVA